MPIMFEWKNTVDTTTVFSFGAMVILVRLAWRQGKIESKLDEVYDWFKSNTERRMKNHVTSPDKRQVQ